MQEHEAVRHYYGQVLSGTEDLQTSACCTAEATPAWLKPILSRIHDEVLGRYYGCGLVAPELLHGARVLDLGCGAGRDCYALSALVGAEGEVVGVDMTDEQLAVAGRHREYHAQAFGYEKPNVRFLKGYIEKLDELDLAAESFDVVVSNCVINLSPDKEKVLEDVWRLLKPGGEMYFSDVYADRRVPERLRQDAVLYGECLSGALYWNDFLSLAGKAGFSDPRLVESRQIGLESEEVADKIGHINFYSATYRLFKLQGLEPSCEDYGQAVIYRGGIAGHPEAFQLDGHHRMERGRVFPVCGNTWRMLHDTRFAPHFEFIGDFSSHYGIFPGCGETLPFSEGGDAASGGGCC
jgi:SAM-dependent methyltransferase